MQKLLVVLVLVVAGCGHAAAPSVVNMSSTPPLNPTPTLVPAPTRMPTPSPALPLGSPKLIFGKLGANGAACYTKRSDSDGDDLTGGVLTLSVTVSNSGQLLSEPLWIIFSNDLGAPLLSKSTLPLAERGGLTTTHQMNNSTVGFEGPSILPGQSVVLKFSVFAEAINAIQYSVWTTTAPSEDEFAFDMEYHPDSVDRLTNWTSRSATRGFC